MAYKNHTVSVIIPVHNEGLSIAKVINSLNELRCEFSGHALVDDIIVCNLN